MGKKFILELDHLKLVERDPSEVKKLRRFLLGGAAGEVQDIAVLHEDDGRCCRREPWPETAMAIGRVVRPPVPHVLLDVEDGR